jgi:hypothetical protein
VDWSALIPESPFGTSIALQDLVEFVNNYTSATISDLTANAAIAYATSDAVRVMLRENPHDRFYGLLKKWKAETSHISRRDMVYLHESYQQIIGMGIDALPFIFKEMRENGGRWFWALKSITRHEPYRGQTGIPTEQVRLTWLEWAQGNGYA